MQNNVWIQLLLILISAFTGGVIVYYSAIAQLKEKMRSERTREKIEILRRILAETIPFVEEGISRNWNLPDETEEQVKERRVENRLIVNTAITYFSLEDENDIFTSLFLLHTNLFTAGELDDPSMRKYREAGRPLNCGPLQNVVISMSFVKYQISSFLPIEQTREKIKNRIKELKSELSD